MKYIEFVNQLLKKKIVEQKNVLIFGQNVSAGSCISGLTRGIKAGPGSRVINTPNCESTLCGVGMGAMMNGVSAIFFMKQLDFLLLGIDQLVNTHNIVRWKMPSASFTIVPVIVDSGYEGPQSSLNTLPDFCSISNTPGYTATTQAEVATILDKHLFAPGFRIIGLSQRLFKTEIIDALPVYMEEDGSLVQYAQGKDMTVACFNLSFLQGLELQRKAAVKGLKADLFSVTAALPIGWDRILASVRKTKRLVVIDDGKSVNVPSKDLLSAVGAAGFLHKQILIQRSCEGYPYRPQHDQLEINHDQVVDQIL